jgi:hypothetical protein
MSGAYWEREAADYAEKLRAAVEALPGMIAEREAAEAAWCDKGGSVRMWVARAAVDRQHKHIDHLRRELSTHRMLADLSGGRRA